MKKFSIGQIYQITAAVLFLIGAIFMLVNTFADEPWAFWLGLGFALIAAVFYILLGIDTRKNILKKVTDSSYSDKSDNMIEHEKTTTTQTKTTEN